MAWGMKNKKMKVFGMVLFLSFLFFLFDFIFDFLLLFSHICIPTLSLKEENIDSCNSNNNERDLSEIIEDRFVVIDKKYSKKIDGDCPDN